MLVLFAHTQYKKIDTLIHIFFSNFCISSDLIDMIRS